MSAATAPSIALSVYGVPTRAARVTTRTLTPLELRQEKLEKVVTRLAMVMNGTLFTKGSVCETFGDLWADVWEMLREIAELRVNDES